MFNQPNLIGASTATATAKSKSRRANRRIYLCANKTKEENERNK